ncbi:MAG TPA: hypothetical protein VK192_11465 [Sphingomicrobium sp.]|jgi:hypothetical protein|nr:hypothetical protein [Sphingomicrobium sp.]
MKSFMLMTGLALMTGEAPAASLWQECQIETVTLCGPEGCSSVQPTLKLYFGDYTDSKGRPRGYYKRCRRGGACDIIENPWIGQNEKYRAFVAPERGLIARVGADGKVTDVATLDKDVLISRGSCWRAKPQRVKSKARTRR